MRWILQLLIDEYKWNNVNEGDKKHLKEYFSLWQSYSEISYLSTFDVSDCGQVYLYLWPAISFSVLSSGQHYHWLCSALSLTFPSIVFRCSKQNLSLCPTLYSANAFSASCSIFHSLLRLLFCSLVLFLTIFVSLHILRPHVVLINVSIMICHLFHWGKQNKNEANQTILFCQRCSWCLHKRFLLSHVRVWLSNMGAP